MISVCLASYNGATYIKQQVVSILNQLEHTDELIISDDGSTDDTLHILRALADDRLTILLNHGRRGVVPNLENALLAAKGDYIFLSDQDDVWMPEKVSSCLELMQTYEVVVTDCHIIDSTGRQIESSMFKKLHSGKGLFKNLLHNTYYGCCICFKKKALLMFCPFPRHIPMHDIWLGFVSDLFYKVIFDSRKLVSYRRHGSNATYLVHSEASLKVKVMNRINLLRYIPLLIIRRAKLHNRSILL